MGAISDVTSKGITVKPFFVSAQNDFTTLVPFSIDTKARPPSLDGMVIEAFSPTLYLSLLLVNVSILADVLSPCER